MKFHGFPRRTPCRQLVDRNGSRSQLRECFEISAFACICVPALSLCVLPYVEQRGCQQHFLKKRGVKWVTKKSRWDKSCVQGRKRCQFLLYRLFLLLEVFSSAISNLLVDWYSSCWNVSPWWCCVHVHRCAAEKKKKQLKEMMRLSKTTQRHESKKQTKRNNPSKSSKKKSCQNRLWML